MGSIRRKPHALNLLHQMKLLHNMKREDAGGFEASCQPVLVLFVLFDIELSFSAKIIWECWQPSACEAWSKASDVAEAYAIGKLESAAAINLFKEVDDPVIDHLAMMVKYPSLKMNSSDLIFSKLLFFGLNPSSFRCLRKHTMAKYVLHDAIAEGCFNRSWCSAGGPMSGWANELTNSPDILSLLCQRMQSDYESIRDKSRKAYNFASVDTCFNSIQFQFQFVASCYC